MVDFVVVMWIVMKIMGMRISVFILVMRRWLIVFLLRRRGIMCLMFVFMVELLKLLIMDRVMDRYIFG